jgi:aminomethyltransferase
MVVVNAANTAKAFAGSVNRSRPSATLQRVDSSNRYALIAVQGPAAREVLQPLTGVELADIGYYRFGYGEVAAARATISRTGYTGEDGFEIFVPPNVADRVWQAVLDRVGRPT